MKKLYILLVTLFVVNGANAQWIYQNSGTFKSLNAVYLSDNNNGCIVGDSGTILRTTNGGTDWTPQQAGTFESLYSISFPDASTGQNKI